MEVYRALTSRRYVDRVQIRSFFPPLLWAQLVFAGLALGWLAFSPPAIGRILLVPLDAASTGETLRRAVTVGARAIMPGPIAGSLVVEARHAALARAFAGHRVLLLAAPRIICGNAA